MLQLEKLMLQTKMVKSYLLTTFSDNGSLQDKF